VAVIPGTSLAYYGMLGPNDPLRPG
jgi:hypothetical protein